MIKNKYIIYSHFVDKRDWESRWNNKIKLKKVSNLVMPSYLIKNEQKFKRWFA